MTVIPKVEIIDGNVLVDGNKIADLMTCKAQSITVENSGGEICVRLGSVSYRTKLKSLKDNNTVE